MQTPLEIAFHNLDHSDALEQEIRDRFDKLEKLYDRMTSARVSVEGLHRQHQTGNVYEVHIVMRVPGDEIVVSKEPRRLKDRYANPDVMVCVREAFDMAERKLLDHKRLVRGEVKPHQEEVVGQVAQLADDHGFLMTNTGGLLYFHRNSVLSGRFEDLSRGDRVQYVEAAGDTGPTASKVWRQQQASAG
jgi:ribosome-associated translation inhibitor RaiA/cold shock CspA family protein